MSSDVHYLIRSNAVKIWLSKKGLRTQKEIAACFKIHPRTLQRWIRQYRIGKLTNRQYRRHWKRFDSAIEKKVVGLKEKNPWLTLAEAQRTLEQWGLKISKRGIRLIWKRFGLGGFIKGRFFFNYADYVFPSKEASLGLEMAAKSLKSGEVKEAARILNSITSCPKNQLLEKIPDHFLSLPRRVEKLDLLYGKISFRELKKRARRVREQAEKRGLLYLAVRAGIMEGIVLDWLGESKAQLALITRLKYHLRKKSDGRLGGDPALRFSLLLLEGKALSGLMRIRDVLQCARLCHDILRRQFPLSIDARQGLALLYESIGHFKETDKIYRTLDPKQFPEKELRIANAEAIAGRYRNAISLLKVVKPQLNKLLQSQGSIIRAICYLGQGKIDQAVKALQFNLQFAKKEIIRKMIHTATLLLTACYAANRDNINAKILVKRFIPVLKKLGTRRDLTMRYIILGETANLKIDEGNLMPPLKLAFLLKRAQESLSVKDYRRAYRYAYSKGIISHLHVLLFFFPEPIRKLLSQGKPTGLPTCILKLPVFQYNIPVYHLKLLGPVRVYRNGNIIRRHLSPKEAALLNHLSLRQGKKIALTSIYRNFWKGSKKPARTFSHLLVSIRKHLGLPRHLLSISKAEQALRYSIHITTDYQYFEQTLTLAGTLERAEQWEFAKREYLRGFALFRGEPFKKMYDNWSEYMRRVILNKLETEAIKFARSCLNHGNKRDAKKVLEKIAKIIPQSEEIKRMVRGLRLAQPF